jgi:hypothetical protein
VDAWVGFALLIAGVAFAWTVFAGTDYLMAMLTGRGEPQHDWFEKTPWSNRTTPAKPVVTRVLAVWAAVFLAVVALVAVFLLLAVIITGDPSKVEEPVRPG